MPTNLSKAERQMLSRALALGGRNPGARGHRARISGSSQGLDVHDIACAGGLGSGCVEA